MNVPSALRGAAAAVQVWTSVGREWSGAGVVYVCVGQRDKAGVMALAPWPAEGRRSVQMAGAPCGACRLLSLKAAECEGGGVCR
eukprot:152632-Chlamydomonas_euryale.AAC.3